MSKICSRGIVCQGFGEENKAGMQTIGYNKMSRQVRVNNLDLSLSFLWIDSVTIAKLIWMKLTELYKERGMLLELTSSSSNLTCAIYKFVTLIQFLTLS